MSRRAAISLVGGESLLGRELRDLLSADHPPIQANLIGVDETFATLTEQEGEPAIITPLDKEGLVDSRLVVLAGSADSSRKALAALARNPLAPTLVDLTYIAEDDASARLRAPMVEELGYSVPAGAVHVIAHPAAIALALFLLPLSAKFKIRRWIADVFEPASERGRAGMEELRKQTVNLFSFQPLPKAVYDTQVAFNMLAQLGEDASQSLESIELRIERHLASLLGARAAGPMPSIRLVQAPIFHGYSLSIHVEFEGRPEVLALASALNSSQVDVRVGDVEAPHNVGITGQSGISVGSILPDRNDPNGCWFWLVTDNFRLMAENAVGVIRFLLASETANQAK